MMFIKIECMILKIYPSFSSLDNTYFNDKIQVTILKLDKMYLISSIILYISILMGHIQGFYYLKL